MTVSKMKNCRLRLRKLITVLLSIFFTPVFLFLLLFFLGPIYFYRWIIGTLVPLFVWDMGNMIGATSVLFAKEWEHISSKPTMNLCSSIKLEGKINLDDLVRDIGDKFVFLKNSNGTLVHPELQQHYVKYMGYLFYKWDRDFDLKNHVRCYKEEDEEGHVNDSVRVDHDKYMEIRTQLTYQSFAEKTSPWEIVLINNYVGRKDDAFQSPKSVILFRIHHGLTDMFSIQKAMFKGGLLHFKESSVSNNNSPRNKNAYFNHLFRKRHKNRKTKHGFFTSFVNFITTPYQLMQFFRETNKDGINSWHLPVDKLEKKRFLTESSVIPVDVIKNIKNHFDVHYSSVMFSSIGGGIRNYSIKNNIVIPKWLHIYVPEHRHGKNQPDKLINQTTGSLFRIPLMDNDDPLVRLKTTDEYYAKTRNSTIPSALYKIFILVGSLPVNWIKHKSLNTCSLLLSALTGPSYEFWYDHHRVLETGFSAGLGHTSVGLVFSTVEYNNGFNLHIGVDQALITTKEKLKELLDDVCREIENYERCAQV